MVGEYKKLGGGGIIIIQLIMASFNGLITCAQLRKALFDSNTMPDSQDRQKLFKTIRTMLITKPDTGDVEMPFGKHIGRMVSDIAHEDFRYLKWMYGSFDRADELPELYAAMTFYCNRTKSADDAAKAKKRKLAVKDGELVSVPE